LEQLSLFAWGNRWSKAMCIYKAAILFKIHNLLPTG